MSHGHESALRPRRYDGIDFYTTCVQIGAIFTLKAWYAYQDNVFESFSILAIT